MTFIPVFDVDIPDHYATISESNYDPDMATGRAVICLIAVVNAGTPASADLAQVADEQFAQVLDLLVKKGISLVCVESMEGTRGPGVMGLKVQEQLRASGMRVVGVDNLGLESAMVNVWREAQMSVSRYGVLFVRVLGCIEQRASQLASSSLNNFLQLRREYEDGRVGLGVVIKDLFELEEATGCYLPPEIKRPLLTLRREAEADIIIAAIEQQELVARLKQYTKEGVLDPDRVTTFRKKIEAGAPPSETELMVREFAIPMRPEEYARHPLAPHETAALEHFRLRLGIDLGLSIGFAGSSAEVEAYQSTHRNDQDSRELSDMAQMLGISLNAYPNFCKFIESRQVRRSIEAEDPYKVVKAAIPKAFAHFEASAFRSRDERQAISYLKHWFLLKKLASLQLTPELYDLLVETLDDAFLANILESLQSSGVTVAPELLEAARDFDKRRDFFISFYDNARKRASGMALGTLKQMDEQGVGKAVLICLGFHRPTVRETLASEQIPFWILNPRGRSAIEKMMQQ